MFYQTKVYPPLDSFFKAKFTYKVFYDLVSFFQYEACLRIFYCCTHRLNSVLIFIKFLVKCMTKEFNPTIVRSCCRSCTYTYPWFLYYIWYCSYLIIIKLYYSEPPSHGVYKSLKISIKGSSWPYLLIYSTKWLQILQLTQTQNMPT